MFTVDVYGSIARPALQLHRSVRPRSFDLAVRSVCRCCASLEDTRRSLILWCVISNHEAVKMFPMRKHNAPVPTVSRQCLYEEILIRACNLNSR